MGSSPKDSRPTPAGTTRSSSTPKRSLEADESSGLKGERFRSWEDVRRLVDEQAEDEGLWFLAATAPEAYLQQELRRLHAMIEDVGVGTARDINQEDGVR